MSGYVFHCSKCKFAHAGECIAKNPCAEIAMACGELPTVDSRWYEENFFGGQWHARFSMAITWTVKQVEADLNRVILQNAYRIDCEVNLSAFTEGGSQNGGTLFRLRPAP